MVLQEPDRLPAVRGTTTTAAQAPPKAGPATEAVAVDSRQALWPLVLIMVLPLLVSAVLLVDDLGGSYRAGGDIALIEMKLRDIGREPVLTGLYSRSDWSHPGPAQFHLLAPFYWLTGSVSIGLYVGALVVNAGALVGMALVARRCGGTPLLLITLLAGSLLVRTLGADFVRDPWNPFMTVLPFGLVVFLVWSLTAGDAWALPWAVAISSYVAQAHVGYLVLAVPLLGFGALSLLVGVLRSGDEDRRRRLRRAMLVAAAFGAVLWLPPLIDVIGRSQSNAANVIGYFRNTEEEARTFAEGWNVLSAQFTTLPEWLTWHREPLVFSGEPPSLYGSPFPWLLSLVGLAGVLLWRRREVAGVRLVATFAVAMGLGVLAVARTVGPVFDYRLRWTWIVGMVGFVVIAWGAWSSLSSRWTRAGRVLGPLGAAAVVAVSGINLAGAVRAGVPYEGDSEVLAALVPDALRAVEGTEGEVLVTDSLAGSWYSRGLVLELERHGHDARVPPDRRELFGDHRVVSKQPPAVRVHVGVGPELEGLSEDPRLRLLVEWRSISRADEAEAEERIAALDAELEAGQLASQRHMASVHAITQDLYSRTEATHYAAALYLDTDPVG